MPAKILIDRSSTAAATTIGVTWIIFLIAWPIFEPGTTALDIVGAGLFGAGLILAGFAAASRIRPMEKQEVGQVIRLIGYSLVLAALMTIINLGMNLGMASVDPSIHDLLVDRFDEIPALVSVFAAPVIEEVLFRLFCMSVIAFVLSRFVENTNSVYLVALITSAFIFGIVHILRPQPESLDLVWLYGIGVTLKSSIGGLFLGYIFWRWGLGYAILCHGSINGLHSALEPYVFGS